MDKFLYDDILNYKYPNPETERDFPDKVQRAAQFAPFAALTGHGDIIDETARYTFGKIELDEYEKESINQILVKMQHFIEEGEEDFVSVVYFEPDKHKNGGFYRKKTGNAIKIDMFERCIVFDDGCKVPIDNIFELSLNEEYDLI